MAATHVSDIYCVLIYRRRVSPLRISRRTQIERASHSCLHFLLIIIIIVVPRRPSPRPCLKRIACAKLIKRFILHAKKTAFVVEHDFIMATYLADRVIVYDGEPGIEVSGLKRTRPDRTGKGILGACPETLLRVPVCTDYGEMRAHMLIRNTTSFHRE